MFYKKGVLLEIKELIEVPLLVAGLQKLFDAAVVDGGSGEGHRHSDLLF